MADTQTTWQRPSEVQIAWARRLLGIWEWVASPQFYGAEHVPAGRPVMFVGNHTLMGVLDTPLLFLGIVGSTGHFPRSMGDHFHFTVPIWRDWLSKFGAVDGTRENCRAIMGEGHSLIVFPGGGREVFKRRGEAYQLIWGKRAGFARLAIEYGYPIVPVASVGAEECYRILLDQDDLLRTPLGAQLKARSPRTDMVFPTLVRGLWGTPFPIPQRFYFAFGPAIESAAYQGADDGDSAAFALREEVRVALSGLIEETLQRRERDPQRRFVARLLARYGRRSS